MLSRYLSASLSLGLVLGNATPPCPDHHLLTTRNQTEPSDGLSGILPCDALISAGLGNRLVFSDDPDYENRVESWFALNTRQHPWCFFVPQNTEEVSRAMEALMSANEGAGEWFVALRSGGHSSIPDSNNIDNGVTIDLSSMNSVAYNSKTNLASVGPGGKWMDVYAELQKYNVTAVGGRDGDVGVGGFLLGGGTSFYTYKRGFGADNVRNFEVVLTNGTVVEASPEINSDLHRALKGGGANFGIVTRYDLEAVPSKKIWREVKYIDNGNEQAVLDAIQGFSNSDEDLADNAFVAYFTYLGGSGGGGVQQPEKEIISGLIYVNIEGDDSATTPYDPLKKIPALETPPSSSAHQTMAEAAADSQFAGAAWSSGTTLTFIPDPSILRECYLAHSSYVSWLSSAIGADAFYTVFFMQPMPSYLSSVIDRRGGNLLNFPSDRNGFMITTGVGVSTDEADFAIAQQGLFKMTSKLESLARERKVDLPLVYMNYAGAGQDPLGSYGEENVEFMRRVAREYDPKGLFQRRFPGGFKISRVGWVTDGEEEYV